MEDAEAAAAVAGELTEYEKFLRVSVRAWLCLCVVYVAEAAAAVVWVVTEYEMFLLVSVRAWLCLFVAYRVGHEHYIYLYIYSVFGSENHHRQLNTVHAGINTILTNPGGLLFVN